MSKGLGVMERFILDNLKDESMGLHDFFDCGLERTRSVQTSLRRAALSLARKGLLFTADTPRGLYLARVPIRYYEGTRPGLRFAGSFTSKDNGAPGVR